MKRIIEKLSILLPVANEYSKVEEKINELNTTFPELLKKSILQEAVQGKLVPQNENDEPASVLLERIREELNSYIRENKKSETIVPKENAFLKHQMKVFLENPGVWLHQNPNPHNA